MRKILALMKGTCCVITLEELESVVAKLKLNKAVGIDFVPNEVLKHESTFSAMLKLMNVCFSFSKVPILWLKAAICLIPKGGNKDPSFL